MAEPRPESTTRLVFDRSILPEIAIHLDISAVARHGDVLFLGCDETAGVERLIREGDHWGRHRHFALSDFVDLPGGAEDEIDIEGLAIDGDWLWVTGSHSLKRNKPDDDDTPGDALEALEELKWDRNRQLLARVPLAECDDGTIGPVKKDGDRRAQHVKFSKRGRLRKYIAKDPLLRQMVPLPSKDNGLDIEGVVARGDRVWLGLRGPVLRGYALILEMRMKETGKKKIKPVRLDGDLRFRKHALDLGGEGIRDLSLDGDDILILTGTAMANDGRADLYRWKGGTLIEESGLRPASEITLAQRLPYNERTDNPEGICDLGGRLHLILHDSPQSHRVDEDPPELIGDIWRV